jgi:hypothetical protein
MKNVVTNPAFRGLVAGESAGHRLRVGAEKVIRVV